MKSTSTTCTRNVDGPARIAPIGSPYPAELQQLFDRVMRGKPPLALFTTVARDARLARKFFSSSLLDQGHLTLRQREIVIHRVTASCGSEYEWGVHAVLFGPKAGFGSPELHSLVHGGAEDGCWAGDERALLRMCDELHREATLRDSVWADLREHFPEEALLELLMLAGFYRMVSYLTNALCLPLESFGARFPNRVRR